MTLSEDRSVGKAGEFSTLVEWLIELTEGHVLLSLETLLEAIRSPFQSSNTIIGPLVETCILNCSATSLMVTVDPECVL